MKLKKLNQAKPSRTALSSMSTAGLHEQKLQMSHEREIWESKFRKCFDYMVDGYSMLESVRDDAGRIVDFRYVYVNDDACRNMGVTRERFLRSTLLQIHPYFAGNGYFTKFCQVVHTGEPVKRIPFRHTNKQDPSIIRYFDINALRVDDGIILNWRDITEQKEAEEALRESRELFHKAFYNNSSMMSIARMSDNRYLEINKRFLDVTEFIRNEVLGRSPEELGLWVAGDQNTEIWREKVWQNGAELYNSETPIRTKTGKIVTILLSTSKIYFQGELCIISTAQDITKLKELEIDIQRLDRLNIVGEMAASIGHEVRNPMTTVRGYLQIFQRRAEFTKYGEQLSTMIEEIDRANSIITEFLSLAKNKAVEMQTGNLNTVIQTLFPLIQAEAFRMGHEFVGIEGTIPAIKFSEQEIRQLILNLTRNSLEAMSTRGILTVKTYSCGDDVVLEIQDTGKGIPDEILKELGKPFVTTKDNGTGLGLPICYRIAQRHKAELKINSTPQGTSVSIRFKKDWASNSDNPPIGEIIVDNSVF